MSGCGIVGHWGFFTDWFSVAQLVSLLSVSVLS